MKKIIAIVTIGASTAFLQVQAQETPQPESTQDNVTQSAPDVEAEESAIEEKVEIEQSALPKEVMDSFENSEYSDMDIVSVYEVNSSNDESGAQPMSSSIITEQDTIPGESAQTAGQPTDSASTQLEEAANQTEQAVDEAATGMKQDAEEVAEETEDAAADVSQETKEEASDFAQNTEDATNDVTQETEQAADDAAQQTEEMTDDVVQDAEKVETDVAQETEEKMDNAAMETEGLIVDETQAVGDTAINEMEGGDQMKQPEGAATEPTQPVDSASLGVSTQGDETTVEMSEDVAKQTEGAITEMETTEDMEDTGKAVSAEAPDTDDATAEEEGRKLYENNQYDDYTEANSNGYKEIAEEEIANSDKKNKQYELQVQGDEGNMTLTYDENGELVKADKGSM